MKVSDLNTKQFTKQVWLLFLLVFSINFCIKQFQAGYASYWYDEIISLKTANEDFGHIKHVSEWDKNPPFYYYCLSVWIKLFDNYSEYWTRLLSVIFSSLAAGVLFIISNKYFNRTTAISASLLFIASDFLYFYSHEARAYSLVMLLGLLSTYIFFQLKNKPVLVLIFLLGLTNFLIVYTHYIAGLILVIQFILAVIFFEKRNKAFFLYSLIFTIVLMLIRFTKKQVMLVLAFNGTDYTFWLGKAKFRNLADAFSTFLYNKPLAIILLSVIVLGAILIWKSKNKDLRFYHLYSLLVGIGSILVLFFMGKLTPIFLDRYLIFAVPFLFILISFTFSLINHKIIPLIPAVLICIVFLPQIHFETKKSMDYREAMIFLKKTKQNGDLVIVKTKDIRPLFSYYYDVKGFKDRGEKTLNEGHIWFCTEWNELDAQKLGEFKRIIVMDSFDDLNPKESEFKTNLSSIREITTVINDYPGVRISIYH